MVTLFLFVILLKFVLMLVRGETFIPTWVYQHLTPWQTNQKSPWNVLGADGLFEFLPWRKVVMESIANGQIPLVNPYAATTLGGQPLLANGQSGFFYPLHWPLWILPSSYAPSTLMISLIVHMGILATGAYVLARKLEVSRVGAILAAIGFSQSATIVSWLPLSTHLTVVAWLPWMWLASIKKSYRMLAIVSMMSMLAGHLQLAMYSLLTSGLIIIALNWKNKRTFRTTTAMILGIVLSVCQLLPSVELGQQSHRGGVAASAEGYAAYTSNAMPLHHLITWLIPNYFGNPTLNAGNAWLVTEKGIQNNYAEWALYTGIVVPLFFFASLFCYKSLQRGHKVILITAILAIAVALGSPLCAVLYFGIPGFAATGNPARVLPILSLAICLIAGTALNRIRLRHLAYSLLLIAAICGVCMVLANQVVVKLSLPKDVTTALSTDALFTQIPILSLSILITALVLRLRHRYPAAQWFIPILLLADLWQWSASYYPVSYSSDAIRTTPGIEYLKQNAAQSPIACIVGNWSLGASSPQGATLPPNLLSLHHLHDIATYDSLLLRDDKRRLEALAGEDLMPPENGNILRVPHIDVALSLGAHWVVLPPSNVAPPAVWVVAYSGSDMTILRSQASTSTLPARRNFATTSLRVGMFFSVIVGVVLFVTFSPRKRLQIQYS
ncbi:MAG: hypothetical protein ACKO14_04295 [Armatimonadota bacterium]